MKKNVFLLFLVLITVPIFSQSLKINYDVDTNLYKFSEPLNLWINFLKEKNDSIASKYWNKA
ncbi:MAG: hypothetical protein ACPGVD_12555, partial [Flavobacteriales bacterium]